MSERATLYINGQQVGCCDLELPPLPHTECAPLKLSFSYTDTFRLKSAKKMRKLTRLFYELATGQSAAGYVRHYRRVKHHQLRKRLLKKRS